MYSVLRKMVLILILIEDDYFASSTSDQSKTTILVPLGRYSVLMPKDSTDAQPVQYKESFEAFLINKSNLVLDLEQLSILKLCKIAYKHGLFFYLT